MVCLVTRLTLVLKDSKMNNVHVTPVETSPRPESLPSYCRLTCEQSLSDEVILNRLALLQYFRALPPETFERLRHFQPQSGCFNKCSFCSQGAVARIVEFSLNSLRDIIAAIKAVAIENGIRSGRFSPDILTASGELAADFRIEDNSLIAHARDDRSSVIYCYLDNDPALYEHLDEYVRLVYENLGVKTRIATVGYSRHNLVLRNVFKRLSHELDDYLAGVRLSISPYTYGWTDAGARARITDRYELEQDLADFMSIFRHHFRNKTLGRRGVCAELRFRPMVHVCDVNIHRQDGLSILRAGNYLYVAQVDFSMLETAKIEDANSHSLTLNSPGVEVVRLAVTNGEWQDSIVRYLEGALTGVVCILHKLENEDGPYFGVDVERKTSGRSYAKFFYPDTALRPGSGFIDGERYLLNAMVDLKSKQIISWADIDTLVSQLWQQVKELQPCFPESSQYIRDDLIPMLESYLRVLKAAGYSAEDFLDKNLTIDTGQICNLGRAYFEYKQLASRPDLPLTPNHERAFGKFGDLAQEGTVYRLAPGNRQRISSASSSRRLLSSDIIIEALDLQETASESGQVQAHHMIPILGLRKRTLSSYQATMIPGQIPLKDAL